MKKYVLISFFLLLILLSNIYWYKKNVELNNEIKLKKEEIVWKEGYRKSLYLNLRVLLKLKPLWSDVVASDSILFEHVRQNTPESMILLFIDSNYCWSCIEHELEQLKNIRPTLSKIDLGVLANDVSVKMMQTDARFKFLGDNVFEVKQKGLKSKLKTISSQPFYIVLDSEGLILSTYTFPKFDKESFETLIQIVKNNKNE